MKRTSGRARVLCAVFSLMLCMAVPLSLAGGTVAEPTEYMSNLVDMPLNLMFSSAVADDGKLYIMGGLVDDIYGFSPSLASVYIYDIASGEVTRGADMPYGVCWAEVAKGMDGNVYLFGGYNNSFGYLSTTQIYDIDGDSWISGTNSPMALGGGSAVTVANGTIILIGAFPTDATATYLYDPVADSWAEMADQPVDVGNRMATYWNESAIIVMGGTNFASAEDSVYRFDPTANTWTLLAPLPNRAMMGGVATGLNGVVYFIGGVDGTWADGGPQLWQIQKYDPLADSWSVSTISTLSPARCGFGYALDEYGRMFAVGGYDGGSVVPDVSMIVPANLVFDELEIVGPTDGDIVDGLVTVSVSYSSPNVGMPVIELYVDGVFLDSQTAPWLGGTVSFVWDTSSLAAGSSHVLTARGTLWTGEMREDSVTVTVTGESVEELLAALQLQIANIQAVQLAIIDQLIETNASTMAYLDAQLAGLTAVLIQMGEAMEEANASTMAYLDAQLAMLAGVLLQMGEAMEDANASTMLYLNTQLAILQGVLAQLGNGLITMGSGQAAAMDALNETLDDFQEQIDRVENKADTAGTYGLVTMVLMIVVIVLIALMLMMARKKP